MRFPSLLSPKGWVDLHMSILILSYIHARTTHLGIFISSSSGFGCFGGGDWGVEFAINYLPPLISTFYYFLETRSINELEAQRFRLARQ